MPGLPPFLPCDGTGPGTSPQLLTLPSFLPTSPGAHSLQTWQRPALELPKRLLGTCWSTGNNSHGPSAKTHLPPWCLPFYKCYLFIASKFFSPHSSACSFSSRDQPSSLLCVNPRLGVSLSLGFFLTSHRLWGISAAYECLSPGFPGFCLPRNQASHWPFHPRAGCGELKVTVLPCSFRGSSVVRRALARSVRLGVRVCCTNLPLAD